MQAAAKTPRAAILLESCMTCREPCPVSFLSPKRRHNVVSSEVVVRIRSSAGRAVEKLHVVWRGWRSDKREVTLFQRSAICLHPPPKSYIEDSRLARYKRHALEHYNRLVLRNVVLTGKYRFANLAERQTCSKFIKTMVYLLSKCLRV
jgi:hypothetical protein